MQDTLDTLSPLEELLRIPSPAPGALGLAADGANLWVASVEVNRIYGLDAAQGTVFEEHPVPGDPIGMCVTGDALRVVVGENGDDDNRFIRRYIMGKGFKDHERFPCPDDTGSFLAYDGDMLYLSQKHDMRICVLTPEVTCERYIAVGMPINGICVIDGCFYVNVSAGKDTNDHRLRKVDARGPEPIVTDLARFAFQSRSLSYDGTRLWVVDRDTNELVAVAVPK
jgi:hypothetical protein